VRLSVDAPELTPGRGHEIFRIVQECLTNVQKHSQASRVDVEIAGKASEVEVNISDNGRGFKIAEKQKGYGLQGIAERVAQLKGRLNLDSSPTRGTKISVNIPNKKSK
jgi:signal transduction histidine kinase